ncbi:MAG: type II secretion system F family protein [Oscillospiraceae bacterium]
MSKERKNSAKELSGTELSAFCAQMALILKSGIPVVEGLGIMHDDMDNAYSREILEGLISECEIGTSFATALHRSNVFPKYMQDMVEIGEMSGRLDDVLNSLSEYYEREESISKSVKHAISYPLLMIAMMILVIGVLVVKVLPVFNSVFVQLGSQLTGFSKAVMDMGAGFAKYSVFFIIAVGVVVVGIIILNNTVKGKRVLTGFKSSFFMTKKLYAKIAAGRFASGMSLMLASGLDTDQSLEMVSRLVDNVVVQAKIKVCQEKIAEGASFSEAVTKCGIFSGVYARMLAVGFKTGATDVIMKKLAERYEIEVDDSLSNIISVLEPSLVAVLSVIVGMILLSVMLPLMGIMSSIG